MKQAVPYIVVFVIATMLAVTATGILMMVRPDMFQRQPQQVAGKKDSLAIVQSRKKADSTNVPWGGKKIETVAVQWTDTVKVLKNQLHETQTKLMDVTIKLQSQYKLLAVDSAKELQHGQFAKLFETMNADEAAKVLANMTDQEVKSIVLNLKARQAGKILGAMDPRRVAKIMN